MSGKDSEEEHRPVGSDDDDSTLPEVTLHQSGVRRPPTQNGRRNTTTCTTPPRPPPLVHYVTLAPTPSPSKEITDEEAARKLRKTEQWAKKVKQLNTKCKKQLKTSKIDEDIHSFLSVGGIVAMEQERREQVEKENQESQSTEMHDADTATMMASLGVPTMEPEPIPLFVAPPDLIHLIEPPALPQPSSSAPSLEQLIVQAGHPELSEMIQGGMVSFWFSTRPCPAVVQEWLVRVACLCSDTQLARAACRALCRIVPTCSDSSGGDSASGVGSGGSVKMKALLMEILQLLGARFDGAVSLDPLNCAQQEDDVPATTHPCIDQQLRNLAVIVSCYCSHSHILDDPAKVSLVEVLLKVLLDPKVLGTPLERDMTMAMDSAVSTISKENLHLVTSHVERDLVRLPSHWQRNHLAQVLALSTHCRLHLAPAFCLACLQDFASNLPAPEAHQPGTAQAPSDVGRFTLEHLQQPKQALKLIETFVRCFSRIPIVQLKVEELYPVFGVLSIMIAVVVSDRSDPSLDPRRQGVYEQLCCLSSRIRDIPSSVWPTLFKDLLKRIMDQVKPSVACCYSDCDSLSTET